MVESTLTVVPSKLPDSGSVYPIPTNLTTAEYLRLFTAYINSGLHPFTFLKKVQYPNPDNRHLQYRLIADLREHLDHYSARDPAPDILILTARAKPSDTSTFSLTFEQIMEPAFPQSHLMPTLPAFGGSSTSLQPDPSLSPSEQIIKWRKQSAFDDWQSAQALRVKLNNMVRGLDMTLAKPADLRAISATYLDIQKVQRLALGLSSENTGIKLEGVDGDGEDLPIINILSRAVAKSQEAEVVDGEGN